ncbi:MAG: cell division protein FtsZ [Candidatus Methylopumilus sp.]|jgi:cell division protein FtsZ|nr:cell division protein FtsZ [Candidatus Methylopumilus sp.]NBW60868.1 cell division protein FtsZ [Methylophilaceae bacterium]
MFEIMEKNPQEAVIKVIGVGGCGGNAVEHMIEKNVNGVEFICANTDMQALKKSNAPTTLQIGSDITKGLGAGAKPEIGREAALEDRDRIAEVIDGADMLFITAGMGGGTGTGAAPVVAQVAKEMGILTVAVVTKPFSFEGKRMGVATEGLDELSRHVDSLIIIPNEKLMEVLGEDVTFMDAFKAANDVLHNAVSGIAEIINCPGLVNVDFADVRTVMSEMGMAMMGSAVATGPERARIAAEQAVASPLLENVNLANARGILVNITASHSFKMKEYYDVMNTIKSYAADDATVIVGNVFDEAIGDGLRVTMVATGLNSAERRQQQKPEMRVVTEMKRDGTTNQPIYVGNSYIADDEPEVFSGNRRQQVDAMMKDGIEEFDIPAFLRKQAD